MICIKSNVHQKYLRLSRYFNGLLGIVTLIKPENSRPCGFCTASRLIPQRLVPCHDYLLNLSPHSPGSSLSSCQIISSYFIPTLSGCGVVPRLSGQELRVNWSTIDTWEKKQTPRPAPSLPFCEGRVCLRVKKSPYYKRCPT